MSKGSLPAALRPAVSPADLNVKMHASTLPELWHEGELIKIGAKVFRHSRYVTFQMAEVVIDRVFYLVRYGAD